MATSEPEWDISAREQAVQAPAGDRYAVAKDIVSGTVGGIAQVLSGQPFDTTKVRLQSAPEGTYSGAMDVVRQLLRNEGARGFYKGTLTPLVGVGACVSVQFAVNESMKRRFTAANAAAGARHPELLGYGQLYVSGAAAGFANSFLAAPIEQVRIRLQTQTGKPGALSFRGPIDVIRRISGAAGVAGIWRAITPTAIRESHGLGVFFMVAEACVKRDMQTNKVARSEVPAWRTCVYGGVAGIAMWLTMYPVDVIKSKMQTDSIDPKQYRFRSTLGTFQTILRESGVRGFFKGFSPTLLRAFPVNAATFMAFEATRRALG